MSSARAAAAKPPASITCWNTRIDKSRSMALKTSVARPGLLQYLQRLITDQGVFNFAQRRKVQSIDETQSTQRVAETGQDEIDEARRARNCFFNF